MIDVKIRKVHPDAVLPKRAHPTDAGMDVTAVSIEYTPQYIEYDTGLQFQLPEGYVMLIFPRSSNSKKDLVLANAVGVLDSSYRGNLKLRFKRQYRVIDISDPEESFTYDIFYPEQTMGKPAIECTELYDVGERIGQIIIMPYPEINFIETNNLDETDRGESGFGSTGQS